MSKSHSITRATVTLYGDNGQLAALVEWGDGSTTWGHPRNAHMRALLRRVKRERLPLQFVRTERKALAAYA